MLKRHFAAIVLLLVLSGCTAPPEPQPTETPAPIGSPPHLTCDLETPTGKPLDCKDHAEEAALVPREGFLGVCRREEDQFPEQFPGQYQYRILQGLMDQRYYLQIDNYGNFTMGLLEVDYNPDRDGPITRWDAMDSNTSLIPIPTDINDFTFRMYRLIVEASGRYAGAEVRALWSHHLTEPWLTYEVRVGDEVSYAPGMIIWLQGPGTAYRPGSYYYQDGDDTLNILWRSPGGVGPGVGQIGSC